MALVLIGCTPSPNLLLLSFPEPEKVVASKLQKVVVVDARPSEHVVVKAPGGETRYLLFPDPAATLKLYIADLIARQVPGFAAWLSDSSIIITVRIENIAGVAETRRSSDILMRYHVSAETSLEGASAINCRPSSQTESASGDPEAVLAADISDNQRQCAQTILREVIREMAPLHPSPFEPRPLPQITS